METLQELKTAILDLYNYERLENQYRLFFSNNLPIPQEVEVRLTNCIGDFASLSLQEISSLRDFVHVGMADALIVYAARMATLAVRENNYSFILNGTIAITIDNDLADDRDVLAPLCLLCDASQRISVFSFEEMKMILKRGVSARSKLACCFVDTRIGITTPKQMGFMPTGASSHFLYRSVALS